MTLEKESTAVAGIPSLQSCPLTPTAVMRDKHAAAMQDFIIHLPLYRLNIDARHESAANSKLTSATTEQTFP